MVKSLKTSPWRSWRSHEKLWLTNLYSPQIVMCPCVYVRLFKNLSAQSGPCSERTYLHTGEKRWYSLTNPMRYPMLSTCIALLLAGARLRHESLLDIIRLPVRAGCVSHIISHSRDTPSLFSLDKKYRLTHSTLNMVSASFVCSKGGRTQKQAVFSESLNNLIKESVLIIPRCGRENKKTEW